MIADVVLAVGCLLVAGGSALAWLNRGALRIGVLNRWQSTAPLPLGGLDDDDGAGARTEALGAAPADRWR